VKIDSSSSALPLSPSGTGKARAPAAQPENNAPGTPESSSVNIGTSSAQLLGMGSSTVSSSPVNTVKVAAIKQAISEGRFQVNSGAVADSLIKSVTDLISSQHG
jgi:negative regulator of flagellin synthesis FlgM